MSGVLHGNRPTPGQLWEAVAEAVRAAARKCGYAVCVHGSMARDLDLVAVPWSEDAGKPDDLAYQLKEAVACRTGWECYYVGKDGGTSEVRVPPTVKPHSRLAFLLRCEWGWITIDLSVMPPQGPEITPSSTKASDRDAHCPDGRESLDANKPTTDTPPPAPEGAEGPVLCGVVVHRGGFMGPVTCANPRPCFLRSHVKPETAPPPSGDQAYSHVAQAAKPRTEPVAVPTASECGDGHSAGITSASTEPGDRGGGQSTVHTTATDPRKSSQPVEAPGSIPGVGAFPPASAGAQPGEAQNPKATPVTAKPGEHRAGSDNPGASPSEPEPGGPCVACTAERAHPLTGTPLDASLHTCARATIPPSDPFCQNCGGYHLTKNICPDGTTAVERNGCTACGAISHFCIHRCARFVALKEVAQLSEKHVNEHGHMVGEDCYSLLCRALARLKETP